MKRIRRLTLRTIGLAALLIVLGGDPARACPNCKEAVSLQTDEVTNLAGGYNWSVLFMLAVPFSMIGTGAFLVQRAARRGSLPEL
jgi:hypothetical protein